jgi:hypothetical protein
MQILLHTMALLEMQMSLHLHVYVVDVARA